MTVATQRVAAHLRSAILGGRIAPGERVRQEDIAQQLGASRLPVREALQALHLEGWVDLHTGRGAFVHTPTTREVNEVFAIRGCLEEEATRLATPVMTTERLDMLREICREGRSLLASPDDQAVVAANARFHRTISDSAENTVLSDFLASLDQRVRWYFTPLVRHRGATSWDEHEQIIEALARGDADTAGLLMRRHTENTRRAAQDTDS